MTVAGFDNLDLIEHEVPGVFSPPKLNPAIDGILVKYPVAESIRLGKIRPNTGKGFSLT